MALDNIKQILSAGFEAGQGIADDCLLEIDQLVDVVGLEAPAGVDPAPQDAGVRAGDVEEDGVELAVPFVRGGFGPVEVRLTPARCGHVQMGSWILVDGTDDAGISVADGVYFVRLIAGERREIAKIVRTR